MQQLVTISNSAASSVSQGADAAASINSRLANLPSLVVRCAPSYCPNPSMLVSSYIEASIDLFKYQVSRRPADTLEITSTGMIFKKLYDQSESQIDLISAVLDW